MDANDLKIRVKGGLEANGYTFLSTDRNNYYIWSKTKYGQAQDVPVDEIARVIPSNTPRALILRAFGSGEYSSTIANLYDELLEKKKRGTLESVISRKKAEAERLRISESPGEHERLRLIEEQRTRDDLERLKEHYALGQRRKKSKRRKPRGKKSKKRSMR